MTKEKEPIKHHTELQSAQVVNSGSGDVYVGGSFVPQPTFPTNNSNLPHRHPYFIGRQDEVRNTIDALSSRAWIVTIDGIGGAGKTTLALEVAHLCKEQSQDYKNTPHFNGYIWISARSKLDFSLEDVIQEIIYVLSSFETQGRKLEFKEQLALAMRALSSEPYLLIIDNFETVQDENLHRFLRDQLPSPSKVLLTSRHHIQAGETVVTIGGLEEKAAVELLKHEAGRLQIPIEQQDIARLYYIAQKAFGIPLVLRWVMETVYNGRSLEWVLESLENATANDIFDYIFERSLTILDDEAKRIFCSMSILTTWATLETIEAINSDITSVEARLGKLVSLSLVEDNRNLVKKNRRYQLPALARYIATRKLSHTSDRGNGNISNAINHYIEAVKDLQVYQDATTNYLKSDFPNIQNIFQFVSNTVNSPLLEKCIQLAQLIGYLEPDKGRNLFSYLTEPTEKSSDKKLVFRLLEAVGDPYVRGNPVLPPMFFGRRELLSYIRNSFEGDELYTPIISLIGERRMGKTSLLMHLANQTSEKCIYIFIDLQRYSLREDISSLLYFIAREIQKNLPTESTNIQIERDDFYKKPFFAFDVFIETINKKWSGTQIVLMLDEFDILFLRESKLQTQIDNMLSNFRSLASSGNLGFITAGVTPLHQLPQPTYVSPFFNLAITKRVSFLNREDAIDLVQRPVYGLLRYDTEPIDYLLKLTGGHPFLIQSLCSEITRLCSANGNLSVDNETIDAAARALYQSASPYWYDLWQRSNDAEKRICLEVATVLKTKEKFSIQDINLSRLNMSKSQIDATISSLYNRDLLAKDIDDNCYFPILLYKHWILESGIPDFH